MAQSIVTVDAFADHRFAGNPASVCLLDGPADDRWMQAVAQEMNHSETAFLHPENDGFRLRWFTPTVEVDLCGHATLASAHLLWEDGVIPKGQPARFHTRSGLLTAARERGWINLDFPAEPPAETSAPLELTEALGLAMHYVGRNRFDYLVEVDSEKLVRDLEPDLSLLESITARGFIITAAAAEGAAHDFVSRFFAPGAGVREDPVTGSAHCCLGPYWAERLGRQELIGYQASTRGGIVRVRMQEDRVILGGQAVTVMRGTLV